MKLGYLLVAETAVIDQATHRLSLFQIVDDVMVADFPSVLPGFSVVAEFTSPAGLPGSPHHALLRLGGSALPESRELPVDFVVGSGANHRLVFRLQYVALRGEGKLTLGLEVDGQMLGGRALVVRQTPAG